MPTTDARGHTVPTAAEQPSRKAWVLDPILSVNDPIEVANTTARAAKIVELAALTPPIVASAAAPLFFWRADAPAGAQLEVTTDGSVFKPYHVTEITASGALIGSYAGQPVKHKYINSSATPTAGDFDLMLASEYGVGGGVLHVDIHATLLDLVYAVRNNGGKVTAKVWNTAGTPLAANHTFSARIDYWTA